MSDLSVSQYKALINQGSDVVSIVAEDGTVRYQSPNSSHIKGWAPEELVGENIFEYIHPDDRSHVIEEFRPLVDASGHIEQLLEFRFQTKNSGYIWLEVTGTFPGPDIPIDGYITTSRDISAWKEREQDLEEAKQRLARLNEDLEAKNERLEAFTDMISHDLRNPLNVAEGRVELVRNECDSEQLDHIENALDRMEELISDLLRLASVGDDVDEIVSVKLDTIAESSWQNVETANARLVIEGEGTIQADRSRVGQLFENLFRNAVEHGGAEVTITVGELEDGFYVEDDGSGISDDDRDSVFETGYSTSEDGTGFGLSIVKRIAQAHGWTIRVTDSTDGGARFEITDVEFVTT